MQCQHDAVLPATLTPTPALPSSPSLHLTRHDSDANTTPARLTKHDHSDNDVTMATMMCALHSLLKHTTTYVFYYLQIYICFFYCWSEQDQEKE